MVRFSNLTPSAWMANTVLVANARVEGLVVDLHMSRLPMS